MRVHLRELYRKRGQSWGNPPPGSLLLPSTPKTFFCQPWLKFCLTSHLKMPYISYRQLAHKTLRIDHSDGSLPFRLWTNALWISCNGEVEMINFHFWEEWWPFKGKMSLSLSNSLSFFLLQNIDWTWIGFGLKQVFRTYRHMRRCQIEVRVESGKGPKI